MMARGEGKAFPCGRAMISADPLLRCRGAPKSGLIHFRCKESRQAGPNGLIMCANLVNCALGIWRTAWIAARRAETRAASKACWDPPTRTCAERESDPSKRQRDSLLVGGLKGHCSLAGAY
jgi:hypothetical protein